MTTAIFESAKEVRQSRASADELVAFCPKCKTFETVFFSDGGLMQTRKFIQEDARIYHDCGSREPCRLYRTW